MGCPSMVKDLLKIYRVLLIFCVGSGCGLGVVWIISSAGKWMFVLNARIHKAVKI